MTPRSLASPLRQTLATWGLASTRTPGTYPVGVRDLSLFAQSGEPLPTTLWYPASLGTRERRLVYAKTLRGRTARGAPPAATSPPAPLVMVAHGLRGSRYDLAWLAESLAAEGFWVAAIDHPGTSARTYDPARAPRMWERARHLREGADALAARPDVGPFVDATRLVGLAHSAGAAALLSWAGVQADAAVFETRFAEAAPYVPSPSPDPRLVGLLCLAPGTGRLYAGASLARMSVATLLISGGGDVHTPDAFNAGHYADHLPQSDWLSIPGAGHYSFRPVGTLYARIRSPLLCRETGAMTRLAIHATVRQRVRAFLERHNLGAAMPPPPRRPN